MHSNNRWGLLTGNGGGVIFVWPGHGFFHFHFTIMLQFRRTVTFYR